MLSTIGMKRANQLTPKCKSLYSDTVWLNKELRRSRKQCNTFKNRLAAASNFSGKLFNSKLSSQMTTSASIFTKLQLRETNNKARGRRFTLEEKLLSLSLYKQSAKCYRLLSKLFTLPGRKSLTNLLSKIPIGTGVDKSLITVLQQNVSKLNEKHKICVLLFDEVSIEPHLQYDDSTGFISGFEDNGISRTQQFADHALVFMIRGVIKKYKQPICYTFCKSTTSRHDLSNQIKKVVKAIHSTGLKVIATICDQGATNTAAINLLKADTRVNCLRKNIDCNDLFYEVDCGTEVIKLVHLFDPPHLLKGIRNNLLNKNVLFIENNKKYEASWKHILDLYKLDSNIDDVKLLPRLTAEHVIPEKIKKMKVRNASQVLSQRVSSIMHFLACEYLLVFS